MSSELSLFRNSVVPPTFVETTGVFANNDSAIEYPKPSKSLVSEKKISTLFKILILLKFKKLKKFNFFL